MDRFRCDDRALLLDLARRRAFATLIVEGEVLHLPFLVDGDRLRGHISGERAIARVLDRRQACVIFQIADAYVSPTWYRAPRRQVPTWNYAAVEIRGPIGVVDRTELRAGIEALSVARESDWRLDDLEPDFVESLLDAVVGFEVRIERIEGVLKLSQNRQPEDHARVIAGLEARDVGADREIAALMRGEHARRRD